MLDTLSFGFRDAIAAVVAIATCMALLRRWMKRDFGGLLPPGPPSKPLVGNLLAISPSSLRENLADYKNTYGDLVFFHGLGNRVLILNSLEAILDLFEKCAAIYTDRPVAVSTHELMGIGEMLPMMSHNNNWKAQRRLVRQGMNPASIKEFGFIQQDLAVLLAARILDNPGGFDGHIRLTTSRTILTLAYGLSVAEADEDYIGVAEDTTNLLSKLVVPGMFLCDFIPIMKYLGRWLPSHRRAFKARGMFENMITKPLDHVKRQMSQGTASKGMTKDLLSMDVQDYSEHERLVKMAMGSLYGAGGETSYSAILTCILAMVIHPDKQRLVKQEMDPAIGPDNLPTIEDRDKLPYLGAIIKEALRWNPPLPIGLPRKVTQDDVYRGYTISKGTTLIPNLWAVAAERCGPYDPRDFVPERFLENHDVIDPAQYVFGFSRRLCPGKALAENSIFIHVATMLACFDILPPADGTTVQAEFSRGAISYPLPFGCRFEVRSQSRVDMILDRAAHVDV